MNPNRIVNRLAEIESVLSMWMSPAHVDEYSAGGLADVKRRIHALRTELQDALDRELIAAELREEGIRRLPMSENRSGMAL